jgi:perosamine synthetase
VTTGEGGMVLTDDDELAEKCRSLRNLCFRKERRFVHEELGWNFRMSNLQAALGVAQLERIDEFIKKKHIIGESYAQLLSDVECFQLPLAETDYAKNIYWVYGIVLGDSVPFDAYTAMQKLGKKGIGTRPFFWPMHKQPVFNKMGLFKNDFCPVAERMAERGFYIPTGLGLTVDQIERVALALKEIF